jgi:predicted Zn-dependent protease
MNRQQLLVVSAAVALFFILYFGCGTQTKEQKAIDQSRALTTEALDIKSHIESTLGTLDASQKSKILVFESNKDSKDPSVLKQLSSAWHNAQHDEIAAWYAEKIADVEKTEESWSIAGANYYLAIAQNTDKAMRDFCTQKAVNAFQNAVSLNPKKIEHKINLALCYTENPPQDNPMKGILLLRELDKENPDNVPVNVQLARLAIKTGQYDKAIARLEKVLKSEPENKKAICLLADAYKETQNTKASELEKRCNN